LIITDRLNNAEVAWEDSVRILAAGWVHLRLLSERFEYIYGVIPTTPIRDQGVAEQLAEAVKLEAQRGELQFYQKVRTVELFFHYLESERNALKTPFNSGILTCGADYVLSHIHGAIRHAKNVTTKQTSEEDPLDF